MKPLIVCCLFVAAPVFAEEPPDAPSLTIPTVVYAGAAALDVGSSLRCPPPYCREGNPLIAWMEPHTGHATMLVTATAMDAVGVWAWHKYVGKKHPKIAAVGLYAVAAVRIGIGIGNLQDRRAIDRHRATLR